MLNLKIIVGSTRQGRAADLVVPVLKNAIDSVFATFAIMRAMGAPS